MALQLVVAMKLAKIEEMQYKKISSQSSLFIVNSLVSLWYINFGQNNSCYFQYQHFLLKFSTMLRCELCIIKVFFPQNSKIYCLCTAMNVGNNTYFNFVFLQTLYTHFPSSFYH